MGETFIGELSKGLHDVSFSMKGKIGLSDLLCKFVDIFCSDAKVRDIIAKVFLKASLKFSFCGISN